MYKALEFFAFYRIIKCNGISLPHKIDLKWDFYGCFFSKKKDLGSDNYLRNPHWLRWLYVFFAYIIKIFKHYFKYHLSPLSFYFKRLENPKGLICWLTLRIFNFLVISIGVVFADSCTKSSKLEGEMFTNLLKLFSNNKCFPCSLLHQECGPSWKRSCWVSSSFTAR